MFGVKDRDTITRWRRDPRVKAIALKIIEDRVLQVTRKVDGVIAERLENAENMTSRSFWRSARSSSAARCARRPRRPTRTRSRGAGVPGEATRTRWSGWTPSCSRGRASRFRLVNCSARSRHGCMWRPRRLLALRPEDESGGVLSAPAGRSTRRRPPARRPAGRARLQGALQGHELRPPLGQDDPGRQDHRQKARKKNQMLWWVAPTYRVVKRGYAEVLKQLPDGVLAHPAPPETNFDAGRPSSCASRTARRWSSTPPSARGHAGCRR
jgi:hypothetical protein